VGGRIRSYLIGNFAALAEFERELISERTKAGLAAARARGRSGAPYKMTLAKLRLAMAAMGEKETHVGKLCKELGITKPTLYRFVGPDGSLRQDGQKLLDKTKKLKARSCNLLTLVIIQVNFPDVI
jgi:DNA invertase Pin-like site-specific DNA recombinase